VPVAPEWLPPLFPVTGKPIEQVVALLYAVFIRDFKQGKPALGAVPVRWGEQPREMFGSYYEEGFWHLLCRKVGPGPLDREFEPSRAERMPWCAPVLQHAAEPCIRVWEHLAGDPALLTPRQRAERTSTYVWLVEHDYVVVLHRRKIGSGTVYFLRSGYHVDGASSRQKFQRKYDDRLP
jgi:hypothetical protein